MDEWKRYSKNMSYGILFIFILFFSLLILVFLGSPQAAYIAFFNVYGLIAYLVIVISLGLYGIFLVRRAIDGMRAIREDARGKRIEITGVNPLGYPYGFYRGMKVLFDDEFIEKGQKYAVAGSYRMEGNWPTGLYIYTPADGKGEKN